MNVTHSFDADANEHVFSVPDADGQPQTRLPAAGYKSGKEVIAAGMAWAKRHGGTTLQRL